MNKTNLKMIALFMAVLGVSACNTDAPKSFQDTESNKISEKNLDTQTDNLTQKDTQKAQTKQNKVETKNTSDAMYKQAKNDYLSCLIPTSWDMNNTPDEDDEWKIYEIKLSASRDKAKIKSGINLSYFSPDNSDIFNGYEDFINANSKNLVLRGKTKTKDETYEPVKEITLAGRKAYIVARNCKEFLHLNSKYNDDFVMKKEKMYVLPAKEGFYVIGYAADENVFDADLKVFEKVASSFVGVF